MSSWGNGTETHFSSAPQRRQLTLRHRRWRILVQLLLRELPPVVENAARFKERYLLGAAIAPPTWLAKATTKGGGAVSGLVAKLGHR